MSDRRSESAGDGTTGPPGVDGVPRRGSESWPGGVSGEEEALERDRRARRSAQSQFRRPLVVEAGAGTGKTTTLVNRIVAWAVGEGWDRRASRIEETDRLAARVLGGIVAITFTEAAAADMAERVGGALDQVRRRGRPDVGHVEGTLPETLEERRRRARALLGGLDHLVVETIHAFCRRLLATHALEAGMHPSFQVDAEGRRTEEIVREAIEAELPAAYGADDGEGDDHFLYLARNGIGPFQLAEALSGLVRSGIRADDLSVDPLDGTARRAIRDRLIEVVDGFKELERDALLDGSSNSVLTVEAVGAIRRRAATLEEPSLERLQTLCEFVEERWTDKVRGRLRKWAGGDFNQSELGALSDEQTRDLPLRAEPLVQYLDHLAALDPLLLHHGRLALGPVLDGVRRRMRRQGVATFTDLLRDARRLLSEHPWVRRSVRRGIDQLLVDEFQDTDPVQYDVVGTLALEGDEAERPGLFIVGDPKQSIYGWRNADLAAYEDFLSRVRNEGGTVLSMVENFRSVPAILEEVGRVVRPVMVERSGVQPAYEGLVATASKADDPGYRDAVRSPVEYWVSCRWNEEEGRPEDSTRAREALQLEARALAHDIRDLHETADLRWKDVGVLLRTTSDLDEYLDALRVAGIPYAVERDRSYYQRREVIEAAALIRCIVDPTDHLALLTTLRSAMVGVPDAALVPLWVRGFPRQMTELRGGASERLRERIEDLEETVAEAVAAMPEGIPGLERIRGWERCLLAFAERLAVLRASFRRDPADVFVDNVRELSLLEAVESTRHLGSYRVANLDRLFRSLLEALEEGGGDLQAVLRVLRRSIVESREAEEARPLDTAEDAVRVMTIHTAKGLDFEHVYLVQLHKGSRGADASEVDTAELDRGPGPGEWEYRLFGASTPGFDEVLASRRRREAAELVRTLYVAMTRAKRRLVLVGDWTASKAKPPDAADTHLDLMQHRRPGIPGFQADDGVGEPEGNGPDALSGSSGASRPGFRAHGAAWTFPALWEDLDGDRPRDRSGAEGERPLPSATAMRADAEALHARRSRARRRQERPVGSPASGESHRRLRRVLEERFGTESAELTDEETVLDLPPALLRRADDEIRMAVGTAIHRALEDFDLAADPGRELERQRRLAADWLRTGLEGTSPKAVEDAVDAADAIFERLEEGGLLARLTGLGDDVMGREVPLLLPPDGADGDGPGPDLERPVGYVSGAIDLLYRDPESGRVVVADFKTDHPPTPGDYDDLAEAYAPQGRIYVEAVRRALGLTYDPTFELWFLVPGRIRAPLEDGPVD